MNINNMTQSHRLLCLANQKHTLDVQAARDRQLRRAQNRDRRLRRRKIARLALDICLTAASVIGILAAIGLLATVAS